MEATGGKFKNLSEGYLSLEWEGDQKAHHKTKTDPVWTALRPRVVSKTHSHVSV